MRIVQSLWSCNKNLLSDDFGWLTSQHHLMSWTLSCLRLREYYDDLHLYTDQNGYDILIKYLKLPYKNVHVVYDSIDNRHQSNYAIAKMLTYAAQKEPFIHVDGDVFVWDQFNADLENAGLVAQNSERGTGYYRSLLDALRPSLNYIPDYLGAELAKEAIPSYNAGILGGSNVEFLNRYATTGLKLITKNCDETGDYKLPGNFNILFEQILFSALSSHEHKEVICLIPETIDDNGYSDAKFANFPSASRLKYLHLIGAKKRDGEICDLMCRTLLQQYPEYFYRVIGLFKTDHVHFNSRIKVMFSEALQNQPSEDNTGDVPHSEQEFAAVAAHSTISKEKLLYEQTLAKLAGDWKQIDTGYLYALEQIPVDGFEEFFNSEKLQSVVYIERNPYLVIIEDSFTWAPETQYLIEPQFVSRAHGETFGIACIPQLFFDGCCRIVIDELDSNILTLLEKPMLLKDILLYLESCFEETGETDTCTTLRELTLIRLKRLFLNKCVFVKGLK